MATFPPVLRPSFPGRAVKPLVIAFRGSPHRVPAQWI